MLEGIRNIEQVSEPLDISAKVKVVIESDHSRKAITLMDLMDDESIRSASILTLTLPWYSTDWAKWVKSWIENPNALRSGQKRTAVIVCNERQKKMAANVFASGVKWVNSEEL